MRLAPISLALVSIAPLAAACSTQSTQPHAPPPIALDTPSWREAQLEATTPAPTPATELATVAHADGDPTCAADDLCQGESCCTRIDLPAGSYDDAHAGKVAVHAYALDKYELTVGRVRRWMAAGAPTPHAGDVIGRDSSGAEIRWSEGWRVQTGDALVGWARYDTWTSNDPSLPKNFIDWYTSAAVCHFAGGRLPTDAEWRYAAVGGEENREFPWGSEKQTPERAVYNCMGDGNQSCSLADILPVGSRPKGAGRWGHMDLAGSMFEWTADAGGGGDSVSRGGGFCYIGGIDRRVKHAAASEKVRHDAPTTTSHMVGARCAFDSEEGDHVAVAKR
jgi:formylglycine-generating enzyme required for sulfatase activity